MPRRVLRDTSVERNREARIDRPRAIAGTCACLDHCQTACPRLRMFLDPHNLKTAKKKSITLVRIVTLVSIESAAEDNSEWWASWAASLARCRSGENESRLHPALSQSLDFLFLYFSERQSSAEKNRIKINQPKNQWKSQSPHPPTSPRKTSGIGQSESFPG